MNENERKLRKIEENEHNLKAVFLQILPGAPLEAQICHLGPRMGHFEAKIGHFEAKNDRFEAKMVIWTGFEGQIFQ